ncbi:UNVERIFIED_CONTAM: hypothetical protein K2H54_038104 [Gekko kuhli]
MAEGSNGCGRDKGPCQPNLNYKAGSEGFNWVSRDQRGLVFFKLKIKKAINFRHQSSIRQPPVMMSLNLVRPCFLQQRKAEGSSPGKNQLWPRNVVSGDNGETRRL